MPQAAVTDVQEREAREGKCQGEHVIPRREQAAAEVQVDEAGRETGDQGLGQYAGDVGGLRQSASNTAWTQHQHVYAS